jgi:DNA repair exonuclease SbcCD nuclease subunit
MFRFLHLADLHLETRFGGRHAAKERLREATLEALDRAVEYALRKELHAVLVAGDLFDDPLLSLRTELEFLRQVRRLSEAGIWFLSVCGNHDPGGAGKRSAGLGLHEPIGGEPWLARVHMFRHAKPETVVITDKDGNDVGIVVGAGHVGDREDKNLTSDFTKLDTELPVVGLLHTQVESARAAEAHERYAPSTPADYERLGYAYWALGHVHLRQQAAAGQPVWYSGNLQGRNPRETGPKGGLVVEAQAGVDASPCFVPFAPVVWERLENADLAEHATRDALARAFAAQIHAAQQAANAEIAVRIDLRGESPLSRVLKDSEECAQLEEELIERTGAVEVQLRDRGVFAPRDIAALRESPSVLGKALELVEAARAGAAGLESIAPHKLAGLEDEGTDRAAYLARLLEGIEDDLFNRCLSEDEE